MKLLKGFLSVLIIAVLLCSVWYVTCITEIPKEWLNTDAGSDFGITTQPLLAEEKIEQHFCVRRSEIQSIAVRAVTWDRAYSTDDTICIRILEHDTDVVVAQCDMKLSEFNNNELTQLPFQGLRLKKGAWYSLEFIGKAQTEEKSISLMYSDTTDSEWMYCRDGSELSEYNLSLKIIGTGMF